ncbi:MAG TPA: prepilin-type N-terminal cleavage/methylation domain-containing protein [Candidatus Pacearchaeota archaeon]|nr:prepilin-type N-terminal cleavage/methylation domain-containing protein [Candidatus Pacearchaeota archaeon]
MNKNKSFTLIELLVVIVIIGILAGVIMISTSSSIDKASFAKAQAFSSTVQEELLSNLVSEWTFDNSSNYGEDTWGNNNGTLYNFANPATSTSGLANANECFFGTCLKFDGVNDYISIPMTLSNDNTFSFSFWIFDTSTSKAYRRWITTTNSTFDGSTVCIREEGVTYAGRVGLYASTSGQSSFSDERWKNKWTFFVVISDGTITKAYMNGSASSIISFGASISPQTGLYFGGYYSAGSEYFNGLLDDIRIYNTALSSSQIKQNYIAGLNSMLSNGSISKQEYNERINTLAYDKE